MIAVVPQPPGEIYHAVVQGVSSNHQLIAYFKVLAGDAAPAPQPGNLPASQNATASPSSGPRGITFTFVGRGFQPGENIGVYITAPDQSVFGAPFQVAADSAGLSEAVTFRTDSSVPPGIYAITFEGIHSKNKAIAYFQVTQ